MNTKIKIEMCVTPQKKDNDVLFNMDDINTNQDLNKFIPFKAHPDDAAFDIMAACEDKIIIKAHDTAVIPAGFKIELEKGYEAQIRSRSGNTLKKKFQVANAPGTIDSNYRGEVGIIIYNTNDNDIIINRGDKIAQMVINKLPDVEVELVDAINKETDRGSNGFGSTGFKN